MAKAIQRKVASGETSAHVYTGYPCSVGLILTGGASGKIQYTLSPPQTILDGTAYWRDWARGEVTQNADDYLEGPVTAVRAVSVTGLITFEVNGAS